jgi:hypothetical protein
MKIKIFLSFSFLLLLPVLVISQAWPKIYINPGVNSTGKVAFETYDNGIILLSENLGQYGLRTSGWLIKTDINGNILWERLIGSQTEYLCLIDNMSTTSDSGVVIAMSSRFSEENPYGQYNDPVYIKLNNCGQLDWCTLISILGTSNS